LETQIAQGWLQTRQGRIAMSQTNEHDVPPSKQPGTSSNSRSWSWRSANWPSRRGCSPTRTTGVFRSGARRSARPAAPSWWPRPGPTGAPRTHANWFKSHNDIRPCVSTARSRPR
jgi:hypothetical protein